MEQPTETKEQLKRRIDKIDWRNLNWNVGDAQISRDLNIPYKIVRRRRYMFTRIRVHTNGRVPAKKPDNFKPIFRRGDKTTFDLTYEVYGAFPVHAVKTWIKEYNEESRTYHPQMLKLCEYMLDAARFYRDNGRSTCLIRELFDKYTGPLSGIRVAVVDRMHILLTEELNTTFRNREGVEIDSLTQYEAVINNNIETVIDDLAILRKRYHEKLK